MNLSRVDIIVSMIDNALSISAWDMSMPAEDLYKSFDLSIDRDARASRAHAHVNAKLISELYTLRIAPPNIAATLEDKATTVASQPNRRKAPLSVSHELSTIMVRQNNQVACSARGSLMRKHMIPQDERCE